MLVNLLTLINSNTAKVHTPKMASFLLVSVIWLKKFIHESKNSFEGPLKKQT